jgi:hypothetical protein
LRWCCSPEKRDAVSAMSPSKPVGGVSSTFSDADRDAVSREVRFLREESQVGARRGAEVTRPLLARGVCDHGGGACGGGRCGAWVVLCDGVVT